jgi:hypothetical protein
VVFKNKIKIISIRNSQICIHFVTSKTTCVTSGAGTAFSLEHTSSPPIFNWVCVVHLQLHVFLLLYDQKANKCPKYNGIGSTKDYTGNLKLSNTNANTSGGELGYS